MSPTHPPTILFTTYTPRTLVRFDGKDGGRILLAIASTVFDVTAGRGFYCPGRRGTEMLEGVLIDSTMIAPPSGLCL